MKEGRKEGRERYTHGAPEGQVHGIDDPDGADGEVIRRGDAHRVSLVVVRDEARVVYFDDGVAGAVHVRELHRRRVGLVHENDIA